MINIYVYSRNGFMNNVHLADLTDPKNIFISINNTYDNTVEEEFGMNPNSLSNFLSLTFNDLTYNEFKRFKDIFGKNYCDTSHILFNPDHATAIIKLLNANKDTVENIFVHCSAGISRSAAVAKFSNRFFMWHTQTPHPVNLFYEMGSMVLPNNYIVNTLNKTYETLHGVQLY